MKSQTLFAVSVLMLIAFALGTNAVQTSRYDEHPQAVRVFYFGNSLTASSMPALHEELGKSAGKQWICDAFLGAGWQSWQHRNELFRALGWLINSETQNALRRGELTVDKPISKSAAYKAQVFLNGQWDAIIIQIFGSRLHYVTDNMWGQKFDGPIDIGDVEAASDIIRIFLKRNPNGRVFIYTVWPPMPAGKVPPDDQLPQWAIAMKKRFGQIREDEFPDRERFNYEKVWSSPYLGDHEKPWTLADYPHWRTRDYTEKVFEGIKKNFPDLWASGRLHHLPAGELFSRLNKKMESGEFPGIKTIKDFYTDVQHIRAGAPAYTIAALFYTGLFRERPDKLDFRIYNEQARYGEDPHHDFGEVIEITPERAKVIHETIWELLRTHPQANLRL